MIGNTPEFPYRAALLTGFCALISTASLSGQTISPPTDGVWVRDDNPSQSGGTNILATGTLDASTTLRSFVTFTLPAAGSSAIPSNAGVWFYMDRDDFNGTPGLQTIDLHLLDQDVIHGETTWEEYSTGNPWNTPGGDLSATPLASVQIDMNTAGEGTTFTFASTDLTQALQTAADGSGTISFALNTPGLNGGGYPDRAIVWVQGQDGTNPPAIVPEPSTFALIFGGLALLGVMGRRRTRR